MLLMKVPISLLEFSVVSHKKLLPMSYSIDNSKGPSASSYHVFLDIKKGDSLYMFLSWSCHPAQNRVKRARKKSVRHTEEKGKPIWYRGPISLMASLCVWVEDGEGELNDKTKRKKVVASSFFFFLSNLRVLSDPFFFFCSYLDNKLLRAKTILCSCFNELFVISHCIIKLNVSAKRINLWYSIYSNIVRCFSQ